MIGRRSLRPLVAALLTAIPVRIVSAAALWDERPLKVIQTREAVYPPALMLQGIQHAEARAVLHVDADGKLVDCLITGYTHPEVAPEALANVREWRYEPARSRGDPVGIRIELTLQFEARGNVLSLTPTDMVATTLNRLVATPMIHLVCKPNEVDTPPVRVHAVAPRHPGRQFMSGQPRATAAVDFYIDDQGRTRMPVVTRATHEAFGIAALDAVSQWQFEPPPRRGRPVAVRVVQEFVFSTEPEA